MCRAPPPPQVIEGTVAFVNHKEWSHVMDSLTERESTPEYVPPDSPESNANQQLLVNPEVGRGLSLALAGIF